MLAKKEKKKCNIQQRNNKGCNIYGAEDKKASRKNFIAT